MSVVTCQNPGSEAKRYVSQECRRLAACPGPRCLVSDSAVPLVGVAAAVRLVSM